MQECPLLGKEALRIIDAANARIAELAADRHRLAGERNAVNARAEAAEETAKVQTIWVKHWQEQCDKTSGKLFRAESERDEWKAKFEAAERALAETTDEALKSRVEYWRGACQDAERLASHIAGGGMDDIAARVAHAESEAASLRLELAVSDHERDAAAKCPVHDGQVHGCEAEELRHGLETMLADDCVTPRQDAAARPWDASRLDYSFEDWAKAVWRYELARREAEK